MILRLLRIPSAEDGDSLQRVVFARGKQLGECQLEGAPIGGRADRGHSWRCYASLKQLHSQGVSQAAGGESGTLILS